MYMDNKKVQIVILQYNCLEVGQTMKGALVFLIVFVVFVVITLFVPSLPPGSYIYYSVGGVNVNYAILGITVPRLVPAVFNGVIYGVIAYLIYEVYVWVTEKNKKSQKA
jgi:hypothetical protein